MRLKPIFEILKFNIPGVFELEDNLIVPMTISEPDIDKIQDYIDAEGLNINIVQGHGRMRIIFKP